MPRFYFDLLNGAGLTRDEEGADLPDREAARAMAVRHARSMISEDVLNGELDLRSEIIVREKEGEYLSLRFDEALRVHGLDRIDGNTE